MAWVSSGIAWGMDGPTEMRCKGMVTRGQGPLRPAATRAMRNKHVMLYDLHYLGIYVHIAYKSHFGGF